MQNVPIVSMLPSLQPTSDLELSVLFIYSSYKTHFQFVLIANIPLLKGFVTLALILFLLSIHNLSKVLVKYRDTY